jgi:hypothetical protein
MHHQIYLSMFPSFKTCRPHSELADHRFPGDRTIHKIIPDLLTGHKRFVADLNHILP